MKIVLAYDHRAYELMQELKKYLEEEKLEYVEFASPEYDKLDSYSFFVKQANNYILEDLESRVGIYACRSGIGVTMAANRQKGIRAGMCSTEKLAFLGRNDDNINVLTIATEIVDVELAKKLVKIFLNTSFEGGRHTARLQKLDE